jgi:hypothetical protein
MRGLQQKINLVEQKIEADKLALKKNQLLLQEKLASPTVIIGTLLSSFGLGFYMTHPHFAKKLAPHLAKAPSTFMTLFKYTTKLLPYFIV